MMLCFVVRQSEMMLGKTAVIHKNDSYTVEKGSKWILPSYQICNSLNRYCHKKKSATFYKLK